VRRCSRRQRLSLPTPPPRFRGGKTTPRRRPRATPRARSSSSPPPPIPRSSAPPPRPRTISVSPAGVFLAVAAERGSAGGVRPFLLLLQFPPLKENKVFKCTVSVVGIMSTLLIYGVLQEKIMRVPYGENKEFFRFSLFLVFCNRITTSAVSAGALVASKKALDPVAPIYKYCAVSVSNILTTTCQYEALKYVSFPVQTLAKCAKMLPVMVWGMLIMQKKYGGKDCFFAFLVTLGCSIFILYPASTDISPYNTGRESTVWGISLMVGYLGFDGFTSTFQDKLFRGYNMEIHNQIFYTTLCSCLLSLSGLIIQGHLIPAIDFVFRHQDCFFDVALLSTVATISQFFISYTIRTFGALTFATIMTTRQLVSIFLSCMWFGHPLSPIQWVGAALVFGALYTRNFLKSKPSTPAAPREENTHVNSENDKP
ncbi:hypothetical protein Taro_006646, partial [Colocasia esculenta]|nr:hypothetical protein [Colocasia esculenta]